MKTTLRNPQTVSFPLGGIGSGSIGLGGDGRLVDWEIFNRPAKNTFNGNSFFAVRAVRGEKLLDARVLCGELAKPWTGTGAGKYCGFGFGPTTETMAGFPNFKHARFSSRFPFASIQFQDTHFPGIVTLTAFNPFIPGNDKDSSLPAAFFEIEFENPTRETLNYSTAFSIENPAAKSANSLHRPGRKGLMIHLADAGHESNSPDFGDLTVATDAASAIGQACWYRGTWRDNIEVFWHDFASAAPLPPRTYGDAGSKDGATLMVSSRVAPRSRATHRFVLTWNFPNCINYWTTQPGDAAPLAGWKNHYATLFADSTKSAGYALSRWAQLRADSALFGDALYSGTLPASVLECAANNLSILKSPTVLRLEDGSFYGWEGCHASQGSCEGTCTHVWNYAYALPFLFPKLERSIRELNWKYNQRDDGGLVFRLKLPLGSGRLDFRPCCDGQFGDIIKLYRDWKISGDGAWMRSLWPAAKKSLEFAWSPANPDRWDPEQTGVLHGRQHHTLDMELFGPNSWLTGFYLAALKAASEMADVAGEPASAQKYAALFERGREWVAKELFNGQWFAQQLDLSDRGVLASYDKSALDYWDQEHREIKYQLGDGVAIDQVVAQWHAHLCGLGRIFDSTQCRSALNAIYTHNFKKSMREVVNPWRLYSLYDEAGVLICTWPQGVRKPVIPVPYNSETMYGFEYSAAALMIQEGMVRQGLEIVKRGRERFDGERRNPWNEFECGSNYARSMSAWSLVLALSGFEFDQSRGMIGFSPAGKKRPFRVFWSLGTSWGTVVFEKNQIRFNVLKGKLRLEEFRSRQFTPARPVKTACVVGKRLPAAGGRAIAAVKTIRGAICLIRPLCLQAGQQFIVRL